MRVQLLRWQMHLDRLSLRERGLIFSVIVVILLTAWSSFIYDNEIARIEKIKKEALNEKKQIAVFNQQKKRILNEATSHKTYALRAKHKTIQQRISQLDGMMKNYQQRTVSEQQLAVMLYAVLKDMQGLKIVSFSSLMADKSTNSGAIPMESTKVPSPTLEHIQPKYYELRLEGNYFSIQAYLNRLEQLSWKLYWDKFDYRVKQFPTAEVLVKFHTLSIERS